MTVLRCRLILLICLSVLALYVSGCGKKCDANDSEKFMYDNSSCKAEEAILPADTSANYYIYISSGFPTATGVGTVTRWDKYGEFLNIIHDFSTNPGFMPQAVAFQNLTGLTEMLFLSFNGTNGLVDIADTDGVNFTNYFQNNTALAAGTKRMVTTTDGGLLVTRTAAVERFNSAKQRVGAPKYATTGACTVALGTAAIQVMLSGVEYVVVSNAQVTPANKVSLFNGSTGACISGVAPTGPATTMWPVDMDYDPTTNKLFVLYYPFTAATTNAQIWSFDVTASAINNGTLLYNDIYGDIAVISATPAALSSSINFHRTADESFVLVGTSNNSVMKFSYSGTALTKLGTTPLIYQSIFARSISNIAILDE